MTLSTRNLSGIAARFRAGHAAAQRNVRRVVKKTGEAAFSQAYADAPKDTTFMANHLRLAFVRDGLAYELGFRESDFEAAGLPFYPVYVIFGTRHMPARDFLFPANGDARREFRGELSAALRSGWSRGRSS